MELVCKRTRNIQFLEDIEVNFIKAFITRVDLKNEFDEFLEDDTEMDGPDCLDIGWIIENHIEENKIFLMRSNDCLIPVIKDEMPIGCERLNTELKETLERLSTFLQGSKFGVTFNI